jgi:hypothetical protein
MTKKESEVRETQEFPTLEMATSFSGVGLCQMSYSRVGEICSWVLGRDLFTHEIAHTPTVEEYRRLILEQFPQMPDEEECVADYEAAGRRAIEAYGETVTVKRGVPHRTVSPVQTLREMGVEEIEVVVVGEEPK